MKYIAIFPHRSIKHIDRWIEDGRFEDSGTIAELAGFDGFMVFDHPLPSDSWVAGGGHHSFDPFVALSFIAKATTNIRLVTGVLIGAYRNAYITAKALASLDRLSGGRVIAGMAAGYLKPEFDVLGVGNDFARRGAILDANIDTMRDTWRGESLERSDGMFPAVGHSALPRPRQDPLPIWIGGNAQPPAHRAVERGDGWMPAWLPPDVAKAFGTDSLHTLDLMAQRTTWAQEQRVRAGKPPLEIACSPYEDLRSDWIGGCRSLRRNLPAYEDAGVSWLMIEPSSRTLSAYRDDLALFADEVLQ